VLLDLGDIPWTWVLFVQSLVSSDSLSGSVEVGVWADDDSVDEDLAVVDLLLCRSGWNLLVVLGFSQNMDFLFVSSDHISSSLSSDHFLVGLASLVEIGVLADDLLLDNSGFLSEGDDLLSENLSLRFAGSLDLLLDSSDVLVIFLDNSTSDGVSSDDLPGDVSLSDDLSVSDDLLDGSPLDDDNVVDSDDLNSLL